MDVLFLACADSASIDQRTNRLSLFNIIEELSAAGFPANVPSLALVMLLKRSRKESEEVELGITGRLNGKDLFSGAFRISFQGKLRTRAIANMQNVILTAPGKLNVEVRHKKKVIGSWPVDVNNIAPPIAPPPTQVQSSTTSGQPKKSKNPKHKKRSVRKKATSKRR
ncbi:MAG: hypothetical protein AB7P12_09265 [Alphaproteobacteria bacterium]